MNELTLRMLEKALLASPDDWETRLHLAEQYVAGGDLKRAGELMQTAPSAPAAEAEALRKALVEMAAAPDDALLTLQGVLGKNRASSAAYLLLARLHHRRGQPAEARKKYLAAAVIDDSISDAEADIRHWLESTGPEPVRAAVVRAPEPAEEEREAVAVTPGEVAAALSSLEDEEPARPTTTFQEIGGMQEVIERIRMNIIYPFKNPEMFRRFNKRPGGGILMYGPPGCGKTHIARATAGECGASFVSIAITDVLSKWLGESERHLHELFETARRRAPTVIFVDEVDAIGVNRSDAGSAIAPLVNVLLTEMDGLAGGNENVMVLAATNAPWRIDNALRRPGRFDRVLFVPPPDPAARVAILEIVLRGLPAEALDLEKIARQTERYSGADLRAVVERASEKAIAEEMRTGRPGKLTQRLLLEAAKEARASTGEWLETARSYATYANRGGLYDDLVAYFQK